MRFRRRCRKPVVFLNGVSSDRLLDSKSVIQTTARRLPDVARRLPVVKSVARKSALIDKKFDLVSRQPNPFTAHNQGDEDHLTEWIAAALQESKDFRDAYAAVILANYPYWKEPRINAGSDVHIQVPIHGGRPDMRQDVTAQV